MNMSDVQTLDQMRAADSLKKVKEIQENYSEDERDSYADYVERLPAAILMNGLGQALAQLLAAAKRNEQDPHYLLYKHVHGWLCRDDPRAPYPNAPDVLEAITHKGRNKYLQAQAEAMAWLEWHKKLAVAYLKKAGDEDERPDTAV
jgi:CRISPR-associated protein Cmr5